jgi:hypothetical protein
MIIFNISGGLGNQFFQYAFGRTLSLKHSVPLYLDFGSYDKDINRLPKLGYFNTQYQACDGTKKNAYLKVYNALHPYLKKHYRKDAFVKYKTYFTDKIELGYRPNLIKARRGYFDGYWGTQDYFIENADLLKKEFTLKERFKTNEFNDLVEEAKMTHSVALHIRRGDYVQNDKFSKIFNSLSLDYYKNAIDHVSGKDKNIKLFIFSDDIGWAKSNLSFLAEIDHVFIENQLNSMDFLEFSLMCQCKHFIMANSTFSWWAAWLGQKSNSIVIAPKNWYSDPSYQKRFQTNNFIPKTWILIS